MIRKKTLRLLLCDYQLTARYYTIYSTFKSWSSDDFTTIPRLFFGRNYDCWLRLFQKLLRLFQPERCDYCSPLLAIGRKPEKSCGESRQWFSAARRVTLLDCSAVWRVPGWHSLYSVLHYLAWIHNRRCALIYLIIIGRLCWPVQRPAWRWYLVCAGLRPGAVIRSSVAQAAL